MRILFYSSVKNKDDFFNQRFYANDIQCLILSGHTVNVTNRITDFFKFWNYDWAFIYFFKKGLIPAFLSKIFFKNVIFTGGIDDLSLDKFSINYRIQKIFFKLCYFFSTHILIVSHSDMDAVISLYDFSIHKKFIYSPHSIMFNEELNDLLLTIPNKQDHLFSTICWMSTIDNVKRKGVDKSLFFFQRYLNIHPEARFIIIGRLGAGSVYLKTLAEKLGISENVSFTGSISEDEKKDILKASTYYLQISEYEGFGVAALEALSFRNFVIHSFKGGLQDTISDLGFTLSELEISNIDLVDIDAIFTKLLHFRNIEHIVIINHIAKFTHEERSAVFAKIIQE